MPIVVPVTGASGKIYRITATRSLEQMPEVAGIYAVFRPSSAPGKPPFLLGLESADHDLSKEMRKDPDFRTLRAMGGTLYGFLAMSSAIARERVKRDIVAGVTSTTGYLRAAC